jgi:hypothetical protein
MDIILIGFKYDLDKKEFEKKILSLCGLAIEWDFEKYNIESIDGIKKMKEYYKLNNIGIVLEKNWDKYFTSYPLILEISENYLRKEKEPSFFKLIDFLSDNEINDIIIAFADVWKENTLVRIKKMNYKNIKKYLNNNYVWCETYVNLLANEEIRIDEFPLIIEVL